MHATVIHELIHFQQNYPEDDKSLIALAIKEGSAEFICELLTGQITYEPLKKFGSANWDAIKLEFKKDMQTQNQSRWFYNGVGRNDWPGDLGYYVGYRLCQLYYENSTDKKTAIRVMLGQANWQDILKTAGF